MVNTGRYWSAHTHSRKSKDDAMSEVPALVDRAVELGHPALGLTDHGEMGGVAELYTACRKAGIAPFPGTELYLTPDSGLGLRSSMHLTVLAYTAEGYRNLVGLNNLAHRHFMYRPRVDLAQIAALGEEGKLQGLAVGTGCRSGPVVRALVDRDEVAARQVVEALAGWFPRVYVELMQHDFAADGMHDKEITEALFAIAEEVGLPTIVTGDAHYTLQDDRGAHDALKTLVTWSADPDEGRFSGSGYWLLDEEHLATRFDPRVLDASLDALADLAERNQVAIPELDTFTLKIPDVTFKGTQQDTLATRACAALEAWLEDKPKSWQKRYNDRLLDELDVVEQSGFAGYLLLVAAITDYCAEQRIWYYTRGSATGSLILYLLRVTQEDPVAWDIRFDRFLSPDRSSPPDVDLDIEHRRRDEVVAHFAERYPVLQVGTTMTYSITSKSEEEDGPSGGSLAVKYYSVQRKVGSTVGSWDDIPEDDKAMLKDLASRNLVSGRGAHPGGYILTADEATAAIMPMVYIASSKTLVTAFDKGDVERMGLPKIDLLGSRVLTALRICCELIAGDRAREYYADIDMKDKDTIKRCAAGETTGLFQFGGWTNRKVIMEMVPTKVADLVAAQALARPAPMNSGFTRSFMRRRDGVEKPPERHEDIAAETKDTYGLAIYQEQLVGVLRRLGLDAARLTRLLKAVKASGKQHAEAAAKVMAEEIEPLVVMAKERGWDDDDVAWLRSCLQDYGAGYSFGKAHSVQYGTTGFRTAYLAEHEPLAYWTGMLTAYDGVKDPKTKEVVNLKFKQQARRDGVKVLAPHVHHSGLTFTPDPEQYVIREGLTSIPHVGEACAEELVAKRPFASLVDLGQRVSSKVTGAGDLVWGTAATDCKGHVAHLATARALEGIPVGEPMRRAKGRIRRCKQCKITYATPLEYEDHVEEAHGDQRAAVTSG